jgi:hypothetical protein
MQPDESSPAHGARRAPGHVADRAPLGQQEVQEPHRSTVGPPVRRLRDNFVSDR